MSLDKQFELSGDQRHMLQEHAVYMRDRDGNDIADEAKRLKQVLIRNA